MKKLFHAAAAVTFVMAASDAMAAPLAGVGTYEGVAGIGTANGDVGNSPSGSQYVYVTTAGSTYLGAGIGLGSETNGTELTTNSFTGNAGDILSYDFNYITSDGTPSYIEYAYAFLNNLTDATETLIFTARTNPNGDPTVPGFGMPGFRRSRRSLISTSPPNPRWIARRSLDWRAGAGWPKPATLSCWARRLSRVRE